MLRGGLGQLVDVRLVHGHAVYEDPAALVAAGHGLTSERDHALDALHLACRLQPDQRAKLLQGLDDRVRASMRDPQFPLVHVSGSVNTTMSPGAGAEAVGELVDRA